MKIPKRQGPFQINHQSQGMSDEWVLLYESVYEITYPCDNVFCGIWLLFYEMWNSLKEILLRAFLCKNVNGKLGFEFLKAIIKENISAHVNNPLRPESTGHRWIPPTKGQ